MYPADQTVCAGAAERTEMKAGLFSSLREGRHCSAELRLFPANNAANAVYESAQSVVVTVLERDLCATCAKQNIFVGK